MIDLDQMRAERDRAVDRARRRRIALAKLRGEPTSLVPAAPIRRRINELSDLGWSFDAIAAMHGQGTAAGLRLIAGGHSLRCERKFAGVAYLPITCAVPDSVPDNMWVPALGVTRRIRALLRQGWRHDDLAEFAGRSVHVFAGSNAPRRTRAVDWRIFDAMYDRLAGVDGGSLRTATRAERLGYAPPLAWDDIDDPRERPHGVARDDDTAIDENVILRILAGDNKVRANAAERAEICRRWEESGRAMNDLARLTGWKPERYYRAGAA